MNRLPSGIFRLRWIWLAFVHMSVGVFLASAQDGLPLDLSIVSRMLDSGVIVEESSVRIEVCHLSDGVLVDWQVPPTMAWVGISKEFATRLDLWDRFGTYTVDLWFQDRRHQLMAVALAGDETELALQVELGFGTQFKVPTHDLELVRTRPPNGDVFLVRDWTPSRTGTPLYWLVNQSDRTIYGTNWFTGFIGVVQVQARDGSWCGYPRGGLCGTGMRFGVSLAPDQEILSSEGHFIGNVSEFMVGHYRYRVGYANTPPSGGSNQHPASLPAGGATITDVCYVYDEFIIE